MPSVPTIDTSNTLDSFEHAQKTFCYQLDRIFIDISFNFSFKSWMFSRSVVIEGSVVYAQKCSIVFGSGFCTAQSDNWLFSVENFIIIFETWQCVPSLGKWNEKGPFFSVIYLIVGQMANIFTRIERSIYKNHFNNISLKKATPVW